MFSCGLPGGLGRQAVPPAGEPGPSSGLPRESALPVSVVQEEPGRDKEDVRLPGPSCQALGEIIARIDGKDYGAYAAWTGCAAADGEYGSFAITADGEKAYMRDAAGGVWVPLDAQA